MMPPKSVFSIGSLNVRLGNIPFPELDGLRRIPIRTSTIAMETSTLVDLSFTAVNRRDWEFKLECTGDTFTKGLEGHRLTVNFATSQIAFEIAPSPSPAAWYYLFRDVFCALCALSGDPLLHSSAVMTDAGAIVFCGHSGAGKSTLARLLTEANYANVINDEINWVRLNQNGNAVLVNQQYWIQPRNRCSVLPEIPLKAIYAIEQSTACQVTSLAPAQAFATLLGAPFGVQDPLLKTRAQKTADVVQNIDLALLRFSLDVSAIAKAIGLVDASGAVMLGKLQADHETRAEEAAETKQVQAASDVPQQPKEGTADQ